MIMTIKKVATSSMAYRIYWDANIKQKKKNYTWHLIWRENEKPFCLPITRTLDLNGTSSIFPITVTFECHMSKNTTAFYCVGESPRSSLEMSLSAPAQADAGVCGFLSRSQVVIFISIVFGNTLYVTRNYS